MSYDLTTKHDEWLAYYRNRYDMSNYKTSGANSNSGATATNGTIWTKVDSDLSTWRDSVGFSLTGAVASSANVADEKSFVNVDWGYTSTNYTKCAS